jgi:hypothetical protein
MQYGKWKMENDLPSSILDLRFFDSLLSLGVALGFFFRLTHVLAFSRSLQVGNLWRFAQS